MEEYFDKLFNEDKYILYETSLLENRKVNPGYMQRILNIEVEKVSNI